MLQRLNIKNFVIVSSLDLEVEKGFTVLTGETGAGKSILIDALELILGARADSGMLREGAEQASITAEFTSTQAVKGWLEENGIEDEETLLLRRTIDKSGKSRAWANGTPVSIGQLKTLGENLIDVHGQHAYQSLVKPNYQMNILDGFSEALAQREETGRQYKIWLSLKKELETARNEQTQLAEKMERLSWALEDLNELSPQEGEWGTLTQEHSRMAHSVAITEGINEVIEGLTDREENTSSVLSAMQSKLLSLSRFDAQLSALAENMASACVLVDETSRDLSRYLSHNDMDEEHFEAIDRRVRLFYDLGRKYRKDPEALYDFWMATQEQLKKLENSVDLDALEKEVEKAFSDYQNAADQLTKKRQLGAKKLSKAVTQEMQTLSMKGGQMSVALNASAPSPEGNEKCEFLIAGHAGVQAQPLSKVASGGELSRVSLAIAVIVAHLTTVPTLIFDEVDTGIGGAVAEVVGRLLETLGRDRQVLCVTHLPQVASCGHTHWTVSKSTKNGVTQSAVTPLSQEERVDEIARMLGGILVTEHTRALAQEMLTH